jgi:hypothetical protein
LQQKDVPGGVLRGVAPGGRQPFAHAGPLAVGLVDDRVSALVQRRGECSGAVTTTTFVTEVPQPSSSTATRRNTGAMY